MSPVFTDEETGLPGYSFALDNAIVDATTALPLMSRRIDALKRCLGLFAEALKAGEPWSELLQGEYDNALGTAAPSTLPVD